MREHGALRHARRAAGVLQERDVLVAEFDGLQVLVAALAQCFRKAHGAGQAVLRHLLLHVAQHEVDQHRFREAEQVADARHDHGVEVQVALHLGQRVREVLQDQDRPRAAIVQLVLQFARRVHRVRVDDREAGPERTQDRDGVLQHVRQHQCDAVTLAQPRNLLQIRCEAAREHVDVAIGQRAIHARKARPVAMRCDGLLDQLAQRAVLGRIDFGRHAGRVMLQPDLFQDGSPGVCARSRGRGQRHPVYITAQQSKNTDW